MSYERGAWVMVGVLLCALAIFTLTGCGADSSASEPKSNAQNIAHVCLPVGLPNGGVASVTLNDGAGSWMVVCRDGSVHEIAEQQ